MKTKNTNINIFEELGFDKEEAVNLKIRANLLIQLREYILRENLKQIEAAKLLNIAQPDVSAIMNGKIQLFTIDKLVNMLSKLGFMVEIDSNTRRRTFSVIDGGKKPKSKVSKARNGNSDDWEYLEVN